MKQGIHVRKSRPQMMAMKQEVSKSKLQDAQKNMNIPEQEAETDEQLMKINVLETGCKVLYGTCTYSYW